MDIFKVIFGVCSVFLAWVFFFRTGLIYRLNSWFRDRIFNDQVVLFSHKRLALLLLALGVLALFSGMDNLVERQDIRPNITQHMLEKAQEDFQKQRYNRAIALLLDVVRSDSENVEAWKLLAISWWTLGKKSQAMQAVETVVRLAPHVDLDADPIMRVILRERTIDK